jgi:pimeloyl-ACP methyl ester carboxylesterase
MDFTNALASWLSSQLQWMPDDVVQKASELAAFRGSQRLLEMVLGDREAEEVRALLERQTPHGPRPPVVMLPGVMGSLLASVRGISTMLWYSPRIILDGHLNLLDLNDEGDGDRSPDVEIVPVGIEKLTYLKLILTLARISRLYEFPYDWRRALQSNAHLLHESLQRWTEAAPQRRFTLVCHSMGGMLARTYAALYPQESERLIERIVMLGTPLHGTAIAACIFDGSTPQAATVQRLNPRNDVIGFASNLPSAYQLLPPPPDRYALDRPYPLDWDAYDAQAWGLPNVRQDYLDGAREWHNLLADSDPQIEMVLIAGCYHETITDVHLRTTEDGEPALEPVRHDEPHEGGDSQVPLWSVQHPAVTTYYVACLHTELPAHEKTLAALDRILDGQRVDLPREVPERPASLLERITPTPLLEQVAELRRHIESGQTRREDIRKITFLE